MTRRGLIGVLVSVLFVAVVFWRIDLGAFFDALADTNYVLLAPAAGVYFAVFWLRAVRWRILMLPLGPVGIGRSYWVATIGYAINNVLPLRVGEFARAFLIRRNPGYPATATLATIFVERMLDGLTLLVWLAAAFAVFSSTWDPSPTMQFAMRGATVVFGLALLSVVPLVMAPAWSLRRVEAVLGMAPQRFKRPALELAVSVVQGLSSLRGGGALVAVGLSQAIWVGETAVYWVVAAAMNIDAAWYVLAAAVAASNLATSVPSSSGAIGPFELLAKEVLVLAGIAAGVAAAYAVLVHLTLLVPVTALGAAFLIAEGVSLRQAVRPTEPVEVAGQ